jgi:hypothetical protein
MAALVSRQVFLYGIAARTHATVLWRLAMKSRRRIRDLPP